MHEVSEEILKGNWSRLVAVGEAFCCHKFTAWIVECAPGFVFIDSFRAGDVC